MKGDHPNTYKHVSLRRFRSMSIGGWPPELMEAREAAAYLKSGRRKLLAGAKIGKFPGRKVGECWLFQRKDLDIFQEIGEVLCALGLRL